MSETIIDENSSLNGLMTTDTNSSVRESGVNNENEETWLYGKQKVEENVDNTTAPSIDEITTQEIDARTQFEDSFKQ
ncbi:unnamed protein product [Rotaria magnacalcarata]|uniref:Uncharacterized protein n=2 Tax=Rotaria magnacalcarata TaxID=392030 RepID=A0A8S3IG51_9BILA|nr:unnamed protein product [Rotaria magnacalcarata]